MLRVPARVVADDDHRREADAQRRFELEQMKSARAVAGCRDHRGIGPRELCRKRERNRAPDRARLAVDDPHGRLDARLRPLAELAAVGNENRIGGFVDDALHGTTDLDRMHGAFA